MSSIPSVTKGLSDWPNWRGANFEGKSATTGIQTDWSKGLKIWWNVNYLCQDQATASWSSPFVQGNRLIVPGRDKNNDLLFCINTDTGELIWLGSYEAKSGTSHDPGPRATPFINDDKIFTFGRSGDLVCWQLEDGKLLWRKNVKDEGGVEPTWGYSTIPLVLDNKVIVYTSAICSSLFAIS
jgi:outer membrane protein assembly factor BamB